MTAHYAPGSADDIEAVIEGLPAKEGAHLWNILKYFERRNDKGDKASDLAKANDYAHRLVTGQWREAEGEDESQDIRPCFRCRWWQSTCHCGYWGQGRLEWETCPSWEEKEARNVGLLDKRL